LSGHQTRKPHELRGTVKPTGKVGNRAKTKKPTGKVGNPNFQKKYTKKFLADVQKLKTIGVSESDIAWYLGVHPATLTRWKKDYPELCEALKKGTAERNIRLYQSLYDSATKRYNIAAQIFLAKNWLGMADTQNIKHGQDEEGAPLRLILETAPPNGRPNDLNGSKENGEDGDDAGD